MTNVCIVFHFFCSYPSALVLNLMFDSVCLTFSVTHAYVPYPDSYCIFISC